MRSQSVQPHEVIVCDDSSGSQTRAATLQVSNHFGCRYVRGSCRGLYANRNLGFIECTGSHIRTMDDDHTFPQEHISITLSWINRHPGAVLTIGEFEPAKVPDTFRPPAPLPGQLQVAGHSGPPQRKADYCGISCGGTVYPRHIFDRGARCSEYFAFGYSFLEFGSMLKAKGVTFHHIEDTFLVHHNETAVLRSDETSIPSMMFAVISHAFLYHPTTVAKVGATCTVSRLLLRNPLKNTRHLSSALIAFSRRRNEVAELQNLG